MIKYRLATSLDNQQLIELTAATGMDGEIGLRIDRIPDFFKLLNMRGESKVFVALEGDTIVGSLCVSFHKVYVGRQIFPAYYIGDFKVAKLFRNRGIGLQLSNELVNYLFALNADLIVLNVAKGNDKPISFFKNRSNVPDFENIGVFKIHQIIGKKRKALHAKYKIESSGVSEALVEFLNTHYQNYELGSFITKEKLEGTIIFTISVDNKIKAAMCLSDTMNVKQNVVIKLSLKMKFLLKAINSISVISGISKMPLLNEPVRMLYVKYLAVNNHEKLLVRSLINHARNIVYERSYSFVSIGLHEKDPLNKCFSGMLKLTFKSVGMLLSMKDNKPIVEKVKQGIPFEDYSLV